MEFAKEIAIGLIKISYTFLHSLIKLFQTYLIF